MKGEENHAAEEKRRFACKDDFTLNFGRDNWLGEYQAAEIERNKRKCLVKDGQCLGVVQSSDKNFTLRREAKGNPQLMRDDSINVLSPYSNIRGRFINIAELRRRLSYMA